MKFFRATETYIWNLQDCCWHPGPFCHWSWKSSKCCRTTRAGFKKVYKADFIQNFFKVHLKFCFFSGLIVFAFRKRRRVKRQRRFRLRTVKRAGWEYIAKLVQRIQCSWNSPIWRSLNTVHVFRWAVWSRARSSRQAAEDLSTGELPLSGTPAPEG